MILIQSPDGKHRALRSDSDPLDGYEGWTVVGAGLPIEVLRERLIDRLKAARRQWTFGHMRVVEGVLQVDEASRLAIDEAIETGREYEARTGQPFNTDWRMLDNSQVPVTVAIMEVWRLQMGLQRQHAFKRYGLLFDLAMLAATEAEIDAVPWDRGWDLSQA